MKEVDFYKKIQKDNVETIRCKSFTTASKFGKSNKPWCIRNCSAGSKCDGLFYQCKKCGSIFGDEKTALNCPLCKKKKNEKVHVNNQPQKGEKDEMPKMWEVHSDDRCTISTYIQG